MTRTAPAVPSGVLLARYGQVHSRVGKGGFVGTTVCGQRFEMARAVTVNDVQALVHKLPLCLRCFPEAAGNVRRAGAA